MITFIMAFPKVVAPEIQIEKQTNVLFHGTITGGFILKWIDSEKPSSFTSACLWGSSPYVHTEGLLNQLHAEVWLPHDGTGGATVQV